MQRGSGAAKMAVELASFFPRTLPSATPAPISSSAAAPSIYSLVQLRQEKASICRPSAPAHPVASAGRRVTPTPSNPPSYSFLLCSTPASEKERARPESRGRKDGGAEAAATVKCSRCSSDAMSTLAPRARATVRVRLSMAAMIPPQFDRCESLNVTCAPSSLRSSLPSSSASPPPAPARIPLAADAKRPPRSLARSGE